MGANIAIIGSGLAGMNLVKEIRKHDQEQSISVFTQESGDFYSKPMLSNGLAKGKTAQQLVMQTARAFSDQYHVDLHVQTCVTSIDVEAKTLEANGKAYHWDKLVLATGANPIVLSDLGAQVEVPVHTVNQLSDYAQFRQALDHAAVQRGAEPVRVGIVGSGLIGCEFANDLVEQGYSVDAFDIAKTPMSRLLAPVQSQALAKALADKGVRWHWEQFVNHIKPSDQGCCLVVTDKGLKLELDVVLSAIGLRPELRLAHLAGLGTELGITVDAYLQCTRPDVYAVGDCASVQGVSLQYVLPLMAGVRALAQTLCGQPTQVHYPAMPIVAKTPAYPVVVSLPPSRQILASGWSLSGEAPNYKALIKDASGQVVGFALTGTCVSEKNTLLKTLPSWLEPS